MPITVKELRIVRAVAITVTIAWIVMATILLLPSCRWGDQDSIQMPTELYCAQSAIACCEDDLTCENEWFTACCTVEDCSGTIDSRELETQIEECSE
jgi:hypothetical protein